MYPVLSILLTLVPTWLPGMTDAPCMIQLTENGSMTRIEALADPETWPSGTYTLTVRVRQGGNVSVSRQGGHFDATGDTAPHLLSVSAHRIAPGGVLEAELDLSDGPRTGRCSIRHAR